MVKKPWGKLNRLLTLLFRTSNMCRSHAKEKNIFNIKYLTIFGYFCDHVI